MGGSHHLLEREGQLADLKQLLQSACAGEGRVGLLFGEAGIGKTALLKQLRRSM